MDFCTDIHGAQKMNPNDFGDPMNFPLAPWCGCFDWNVLTTFGWISIKSTHIHGSLRMNSNNFDDPLTFYLAWSSVQKPNLSNTFGKINNIPISLSCTLVLISRY